MGPKIADFLGHAGLQWGDNKGHGFPQGAIRPKSTQEF